MSTLEGEVDRRRGGKTILKSRQEWTWPVQLRRLKKDHVEKDYCDVCGAQPTFQGYGID